MGRSIWYHSLLKGMTWFVFVRIAGKWTVMVNYSTNIYTLPLTSIYIHYRSPQYIYTTSHLSIYTLPLTSIYIHYLSPQYIYTTSHLNIYTLPLTSIYIHYLSPQYIHTTSHLNIYTLPLNSRVNACS